MPSLLAVPNFSEGRQRSTIEALRSAVAPARLLDTHSDADHNRTVLTVTAAAGELAAAVTRTAAAAVERIDLLHQRGAHPRIGAIDIAPIVYMTQEDRGAACAEALLLADKLGSELNLPVFLYGILSDSRRTRAQLRQGGAAGMQARLAKGELKSDFGPSKLSPTSGAVIVGARPPLIAFNVELAAPATLGDAQKVAQTIREGGPHGLPGLRAIAVRLTSPDRAQVSMNIEDFHLTPLPSIVEAIQRHVTITRAELVGLAPRAAVVGLSPDLNLLSHGVLEDALTASTPPTTNN